MKRSGFTLIEMMVVVAIIGILASIATPAFIKYVKQSKTSEATLNLKTISDGASAYYQADQFDTDGNYVAQRQFPGVNGESKVPGSVPKGVKVITPSASWSASPWSELNFGMSKSHYYQYAYELMAPNVFSSRARGDLDGDGTTSFFVLSGEADIAGEIKLSAPYILPGSDPLE
jgi:prepilin-type N-terminal cleavage/methylation domain-containing protein